MLRKNKSNMEPEEEEKAYNIMERNLNLSLYHRAGVKVESGLNPELRETRENSKI